LATWPHQTNKDPHLIGSQMISSKCGLRKGKHIATIAIECGVWVLHGLQPIANVNFLYDDIVHALQNTIDSCIAGG